MESCRRGYTETAMLLLSEGAAYSFRDNRNKTAQDYAIEANGWNWNEMLAQANINYFDQLVTCINVANTLPKKKKVIKPSTRKRKRDEMEEEEEENENKEIPFLEDFMLEVINSDLMMPKFVFPFLSFNPGNIHESGQGMTEFPIKEEENEEEEEEEDEDEYYNMS